MAWDDDKATATDPANPTPNERLTADEWDAHVADQKSRTTLDEVTAAVRTVPLPAPAVSTSTDLVLYIGGHWVGTDDPAVEYPNIVADGHRWTNPVENRT